MDVSRERRRASGALSGFVWRFDALRPTVAAQMETCPMSSRTWKCRVGILVVALFTCTSSRAITQQAPVPKGGRVLAIDVSGKQPELIDPVFLSQHFFG